MRNATTIACLVVSSFAIPGGSRLASALELSSPFALGDLSSLAETGAPAPSLDSSLEVNLSSLSAMPFSAAAAATGADNDGSRGGSGSYITAKIGPMWFLNDFDDLDTGFNTEVAVGFHVLPFLALEFQSGYFRGTETNGDVDTKLWGVPAVVNARLSISVLILEIYGGLGVGLYYLDSKLDIPGDDERTDDVVVGGDIFAGVGVNLGPLLVAIEGKFIATSEADFPGNDRSLQAFAAMATVGFGF